MSKISPPGAPHDESALALARAREYPYSIPLRSFVYRDGGIDEFDAGLCRGRTPVLAIGSNQSPRRLAEKFGDDASHVIPVQRARLRHFDVVYSAHISSYGAVPAMLQVSDGSEVEIAVTWLNDAQLDVMNHSEIRAANYDFALLENLELKLHGGGTETRAHAYVSSRGHLCCDGEPAALSAIRCVNRRFRAIDTARALELVRRRVAPGLDQDAFLLRLVNDEGYRREVTSLIGADAGPFSYPFELAG